jgi:hypothetical protein
MQRNKELQIIYPLASFPLKKTQERGERIMMDIIYETVNGHKASTASSPSAAAHSA